MMTRLLAFLLWTTLSMLSVAHATPITVLYGERIDGFALTVVGGDFDSDDSHTVTRGTIWRITVNIIENAGFINDLLTIRGAAQHLRGPHGEGQSIDSFTFNFTINADNFEEGNFDADPVTASIEHQLPNHLDDYTANLNFSVTSNLGVDDITGYTLKVIGVHCAPTAGLTVLPDGEVCPLPPAPVSLPSSFLLVGSGLAAWACARRSARYRFRFS
jgi:hypothetical protein